MLADVTIAEIGDSLSVAYCGRMLSDAGARVIAGASTPDKRAYTLKHGADFAIDPSATDAGKTRETIEQLLEDVQEVTDAGNQPRIDPETSTSSATERRRFDWMWL